MFNLDWRTFKIRFRLTTTSCYWRRKWFSWFQTLTWRVLKGSLCNLISCVFYFVLKISSIRRHNFCGSCQLLLVTERLLKPEIVSEYWSSLSWYFETNIPLFTSHYHLVLTQKPLILFTGTCNDTNVGIRDDLKVIPNENMTASTEKGSNFLAKFGRLQGTNAWCPDPVDSGPDGPYLEIDLGQKYVICGVEAQGEPGASVTTSFTLDYSDDRMSFTNSGQVMSSLNFRRFFPLLRGGAPMG